RRAPPRAPRQPRQPRAPRQPDGPREPSGPDGLPPAPRGKDEALLQKYQSLLHKHEALVEKLERHTTQRFSTYKLSTWALETSASALALLRDGRVVLANSRWHALAGLPGPWLRRSGREAVGASAALASLREAANHEASALSAEGPRLSRYQRSRTREVWEVRAERLATPMGELVQVLARDITAEVQAEEELERARAALAQREHLRSLGELVSGIAHDLNSTLNAMRLRLELLRRDPAFASAPPTHLDAMMRILVDASTRISRLQSFARQQPEDSAEQVRLEGLVRDAVDIARSDIEHRAALEGLCVRIEVDVPPLPPVKGSAADLRFVFINLLLNARDAMPRGGTIRMRGRHEQDSVILTVEDEGTGIRPEHLKELFRPFFTTKGDQGTGLGLSMAYGVMARAGGTLTAANRPEAGAVFTLTFPVPGAPAGGPPAPRSPRRRTKPG
ncbi:MAG TPA: ATP-binding protein, partial [Myxococcus sp.]|nr:ATP-binding protein [Myxococcus sp.]